jgi:hypothetical protein
MLQLHWLIVGATLAIFCSTVFRFWFFSFPNQKMFEYTSDEDGNLVKADEYYSYHPVKQPKVLNEHQGIFVSS